ncbi:S-layer homology domain-containing protein [Paenibacillus sp. MMS20-IR301]|uniref:S-layer homology domain-containing protein n=1 Tax=Paenibacillus sp. MMS20-IR301 TaxID=2895946 RepID=UPI0028EC5184|nr:S-layer homology domain-containing protein [Paenibacillus sp. MMS20-IR301]WNS46421.1 S-layer homology domain-containing protein [Paenibacillus sp. MMS20-IR301]
MLFSQKWIKLISCALLLVPLLPAGQPAEASGGSWSEHADVSWYETNYSTFIIDSAAKLAGVAKLVNDGTTDFSGKTLQIAGSSTLSLADYEWMPIGTGEHPFRGILIGQAGQSPDLTGLRVTDSVYGGLIGRMSGATVGRFTLSGSIQTTASGDAAVGGVAGYMDEDSTILDVTSDVAVQVAGTVNGNVYAGGIVGSGSGMLSGVVNHGSIVLSGAYWGMAGGIAAATNGNLSLKKSENTAPVSVTGSVYKADAGGLIGLASAPLFMAEEDTFMRNSGQIRLQDIGSGSAGGIIGRAGAEAVVTFSAQTANSGEILVNSGAATAGTAAGGLIGAYENSGGLNVSIPFVQTASAITNKAGQRAYTGSIAGSVAGNFTWGSSVLNSTPVTAGGSSEVYTGAIAGKVDGIAAFQAGARNKAAIQVEASGNGVYTGGLIGFAGQRLLLQSNTAEAYGNTGRITVAGTASDVLTGGIIANRNYHKAAGNVYSEGDIEVTAAGRVYTGGFVGKASDGDSGIAGEAYGGSINVAANAPGADSQVYTGGIIGYYGLSGVIENTTFTGGINVAGGAGVYSGGVAGYMTGGGVIAGAAVGGTVMAPALIRSSGNAGGVAGYADGSIQSAAVKYTEISISGTGGSAGGIAGTALGRITDADAGDANSRGTDSLLISTAVADSAAGGIVGDGRGGLVVGTAAVNRISLSAGPGAVRSRLGGLAGKISAEATASVHGEPIEIRNITLASAAASSAIGGVIGEGGMELDSDALQAVSGISIEAQGEHSDLGGIAGSSSGRLSGLTVLDLTIQASGNASRIGGVAGFTSGAVANPAVAPGDGQLRLSAEGTDSAIGGIAGATSAGAVVSGNGTDSNVSGLSVTTANAASGSRIGGIVGEANASALRQMVVENPALNAPGEGSRIGGLAGQVTGGEIERSVVRGVLPDYAVLNVSGSGVQAGGLAGRAENSVLTGSGAAAPAAENLLLTGTETATGLYAGGIVGYNSESSIGQMSGSTLKLAFKGTGTTAGGVAGYNRGIAGYSDPGASRMLKDNLMNGLSVVLSASATGSTTGGLVGLNDSRSDEDPAVAVASSLSSIQNSKLSGSITVHGASSVTGGLIGENRSFVAKNSLGGQLPVLSDGGKGLIGGLIGRNTGTIYYMSSNAVLSSGGVSNVIGGLIGENTGRVVSSYLETDLKSDLAGTAGSYALLGGLIGRNNGSVEKSFTMSKVTGNGAYVYVGGLIGEHSGSIADSYAGKDVSASGKGSYSGGLIGRITGGTVASSYSAGRITGDKGAYPGGFAGYYASTSKKLIDDAYYVKDESLSINSGVLDFGGGVFNELNNYARLSPILSSALADRKAFPALSGWTFGSSPWRYSLAGANYKYPELNLSADADDEGNDSAGMNLNWYTQNPDALRFTIRTEDELAGLAAIVNGKASAVEAFNFIGRTVNVTEPISIRASRWTPIGANANHPFEGTFNGNHNLISNFQVTAGEYAGLFGVIGSEAVVRQVSVAPLSLTGSGYAGALAGFNHGKVEQVQGSLLGGSEISGGTAAGGLIGASEGQVSGLSMTISGGSKVSSAENGAYVGGLIGDNLSGLDDSSLKLTAGIIEAAGDNAAAGGLAGRMNGKLTALSLLVQDGGGIVAAGENSTAGGLAGVAESGTADGLSVDLAGGSVQALAEGSVAGGVFGRSATGHVIRNAKVRGDRAQGTVIAASAAAGGIVGAKAGFGNNRFDIEAVEVRDVTITTAGEGGIVGGIAGKLADAALKEAVFSGTLLATGNGAIAGGITGQAKNSILYKLESSPQIQVSASSGVLAAGGVAGTMESSQRDTSLDFGLMVPLYHGIYEAKLASGIIAVNAAGQQAEVYAGGIAGKLDSVSLYNSSAAVSLELSGAKTITAGGAAGYAKDSRLVGIDTGGQIQAENSTNYNVGGLAGQSSGGSIAYARAEAPDHRPIVIGESTATGRTEADAHIGGFIGLADGTDIYASSAALDLQLDSANPYLTVYAGGFAGLLGEEGSGTIILASASGRVTVSGAAGIYTGGFAGTVNQYRIEQAYASGNVSGTAFDARGGGFAGVINHGSEIEDAYAAQEQVKVAGRNGATRAYAGGFAGYNDGSLARVYERVSEVAAVAGGSNSYMGAFIGYNYRSGLIENSYYEGKLSPIGHDASSGGRSSQLKQLPLAGSAGLEGWGFSGNKPVWGLAYGVQPYAPVLQNMSDWRFAPDLHVLTLAGKHQTAFTAGTAEELAGLALLNDEGESVYALLDPGTQSQPEIGSVTLTADISLAAKPWLPVASYKGVLDGQEHVISGLNYHAGSWEHSGLIADNYGTIINLKLQDTSISGAINSGAAAGVNHPEASIKNVAVSGGSISAKSAGGVAGVNQGLLAGVIVENLKVAGAANAGGASGSNQGQIKGAAVKGLTDITSPALAGGITGLNEGSVESSYTRAVITASGPEGTSIAGGVAGQNGTEGAIKGSFSYSDVAAAATDASSGGITGVNSGLIAESYNTGTVEAAGKDMARAGGIAGYIAAGTITGSVNGGQSTAHINGKLVKGRTLAGGIAGQAGAAAALIHNIFDAQMLQVPAAYNSPEGSKVTGVQGQAEGTSTLGLTGGTLPAGLDASVWKAVQGFYPQLTHFSGSLDSELSTVAVVLKEGDTAFKVSGSYTATPDATIRWTALGESGPIYLTASKDGQSRLIVINRTPLTYDATAAAPVSPTALEFKDKTEVVLASTEAEGQIHYTVDGTAPSGTSPVYSKPIAISVSTTVKAITVAMGKNDSGLLIAEFKKLPDPGNGGNGGDSGGGSGSPGSGDSPVQRDESPFDILVNGVAKTVAQAKDSVENGRATTTIVADEALLAQLLQETADSAEIKFVFKKNTDVNKVELSGKLLKLMAEHQAVILLDNGTAGYRVPTVLLEGSVPEQAVLNLEIASMDEQGTKLAEQASKAGPYSFLVKPMVFRAVYTYGNQQQEMDRLNAYVERTITLPGTAGSTSATGVSIAADGTVSPLPTRITGNAGELTAVIHSLSLSGMVGVAAVRTETSYRDAQSHWAEAAIADLTRRWIVNGVGEASFEPDRSITRAEFSAMIVKALGIGGAAAEGGKLFSDVSAGAWYASSVETAFRYALISGYPDGSFGAQEAITRQEMMVILFRSMQLTGLQTGVTAAGEEQMLERFADAGRIAGYAKNGFAAGIRAGLITGRSATTLAPAELTTRAEAVTIIEKLLRLSGLI